MNIREVAELTDGEIQGLSPDTYVSSIGIDSRMIDRGSLFFALKGENNDGHNFIRDAINNGAIGAVMHNRLTYPGIIVTDTTEALFNLSSGIRERFPIPLIGVAGSSGKTTSKELIYLVLKEKFQTIRSEGNQNTQFSLPIMVFKTPRFEIAIAELGMRKPGDMNLLARITRPNAVVFTHLDKEHLEFFNSFEDVVREELSIIEEIKGLKVIFNKDDENLKDLTGVSYGIESDSDIRGFYLRIHNEGTSFKVMYPDGDVFDVNLKAFGRHIVEDALSALAVGWVYDVPKELAIKGVEDFVPIWGRMQPIRLANGTLIIFDGYNANPLSMKRALETAVSLDFDKKLYILADMLELGSDTESSHRDLGYILKSINGYIILIGKYMAITKDVLGERAVYFKDLDSALLYIKESIYRYDMVLIKGSRGMRLERILEVVE